MCSGNNAIQGPGMNIKLHLLPQGLVGFSEANTMGTLRVYFNFFNLSSKSEVLFFSIPVLAKNADQTCLRWQIKNKTFMNEKCSLHFLPLQTVISVFKVF